MNDELRELTSRRNIEQVCVDYARALDTRNWDLLRSCFVESPRYTFTHNGQVNTTLDAIVETSSGVAALLDQAWHLVGNFDIRIDDQTARCESYFFSQHVKLDHPVGPRFIVAGAYHDDFVIERSRWRIAHRTHFVHWTEGNAAVVPMADPK